MEPLSLNGFALIADIHIMSTNVDVETNKGNQAPNPRPSGVFTSKDLDGRAYNPRAQSLQQASKSLSGSFQTI